MSGQQGKCVAYTLLAGFFDLERYELCTVLNRNALCSLTDEFGMIDAGFYSSVSDKMIQLHFTSNSRLHVGGHAMWKETGCDAEKVLLGFHFGQQSEGQMRFFVLA